MEGRRNGPMVNIEAGNCKAERELSVAEKLGEMAIELAIVSESVAARVENRLSPISWPEPPVPEKLRTEDDTWPEYFAMLREQLRRIQEAQRRIDNVLDRTGI